MGNVCAELPCSRVRCGRGIDQQGAPVFAAPGKSATDRWAAGQCLGPSGSASVTVAGRSGRFFYPLPFQYRRSVGLFEGNVDHALNRDAVRVGSARRNNGVDTGDADAILGRIDAHIRALSSSNPLARIVRR